MDIEINEVQEIIKNLESGSELSIKEEKYLKIAKLCVQPAADNEPVAWTWHYREQWHVTNDERRAEFVAKDGDVDVLPLYRHAQPAPVVPGKWIPVSERMPDNTEPVLCIEKRADFGTYGQPFVCWHDGDGWVGKTNYRPIVTHWMPLPAAPQEEKP